MMTHANTILLDRLFTSLDGHDHAAMAGCYGTAAKFSDIAFCLEGRKQIHAMWHMICEGDIRAKFHIVDADNHSAQVNVTDDYTFSSTGRKVHNVIQSRFRFQDGVIIEHQDSCDARAWAAMALGGASGWFAGRFHLLRSKKAHEKLDAFVARHPEYR
jgi:predicted SnoaL-like aldol condensation-catalyzing enzyme